MHSTGKVIFALLMLAAAIVTAATFRVYLVRDDSGGFVVWNANEAYVFIAISHRGAHLSYLEYPLMSLRQYLGAIRPPDDDRGSRAVIRVTASGVEQHVMNLEDREQGSGPDLYTPFGDRVYANCPALGGLCRWDGDRFEPATKEESTKLQGINHLVAKDFDNVDGWSKKGIGAGPSDFARSVIKVGDRFTITEKSEPIGRTGYSGVSIYVQRPGQAPERIWHLDGHPRRVSKAEYEEAFGRH